MNCTSPGSKVPLLKKSLGKKCIPSISKSHVSVSFGLPHPICLATQAKPSVSAERGGFGLAPAFFLDLRHEPGLNPESRRRSGARPAGSTMMTARKVDLGDAMN